MQTEQTEQTQQEGPTISTDITRLGTDTVFRNMSRIVLIPANDLTLTDKKIPTGRDLKHWSFNINNITGKCHNYYCIECSESNKT